METVIVIIIGLIGVCAFLVSKVWWLEKELMALHETVCNLSDASRDFAEAVMDVFMSCKKEDK